MLAERLASIESSPTLALSAKAKALKKEGKPVADFTAGEPDFPTPEFIRQAAIRGIEGGNTRYTAVAGVPDLRAAVAKTLNTRRGTSYAPEAVVVSCGAKHVLFNALLALCQAGDEVIILSPYWVSYTQMVYLTGATPVLVETSEADGFLPTEDRLRAAFNAKTKAIILNSPCNPTGAVMGEKELRLVAKLAREHDVWIISDEIYEDLVYAPAAHVSIVTVDPGVIGRTLVVSGVSKTYSMTGWRIGYAAGPKEWVNGMIDIQSHSTSNPTSISQDAALAAITGDQSCVAEMRAAFQKRRDRIVSGLNGIPGFRCPEPPGAFYAWCAVEAAGLTSADVAREWLEQQYIAVVPGEGFGAEGWVRMSFATSLDTIDEGIKRLKSWQAKRG